MASHHDARFRFADHGAGFAANVVLDEQIALASIAAPTGHEAARADEVFARLAKRPELVVRRDDVGNVIARVNPRRAADGAAPIVVMAHLDTVFDEPQLPAARYEGSRVYLPGIGDNGRGLAAMLAVADQLCATHFRAELRRPVEFVATVGEEGAGNLRGAKHYFAHANRESALPVAAIALDGAGDSHVVHHGIASRRMRYAFHGDGGHPWTDRHAANATYALGRALTAIARLADNVRSDARITVTRVGGGESLTSIPAHAWFDVDVRARHATNVPLLLARVRTIVERAAAETTRASSAMRVSDELLGDRPGGVLDAAHPLVSLAFDATRWANVEPQSASASTDANIALSLGIPAIAIGAGGSGGGAHSADEWYDDENGARGLARALRVIFGAATMPRVQ